MNRNIILVTATISPKANQPSLQITDASSRLQEYRDALREYIKLLDIGVVDAIVFAENSNYPVEDLRCEFDHPGIEWISTYDLDHPSSYHRGYGEFRLIEYAVGVSSRLASLGANDTVWKVTGRYRVPTLARLVRFQPTEFDLCCLRRPHWIETSVIAWRKRAYDLLVRGFSEQLTCATAPEVLFARHAQEVVRRHGLKIKPFPWPLVIEGRRGSDGTPFRGRLAPLREMWAYASCALTLVWRR